MEIYVPGYSQEIEAILKEDPNAAIASYQSATIKHLVFRLEQSTDNLALRMLAFRGGVKSRPQLPVPIHSKIPLNTSIERGRGLLRLTYNNEDAQRYGKGVMEFKRTRIFHPIFPDYFPAQAVRNITLGWHTDQQTLPQIQVLAKDPIIKWSLRTQYFIYGDKLGKIIDLPLEVEDDRLQFSFHPLVGPKRLVVQPRPLDYALYAVAINQFNAALDAFHIKKIGAN
jgi:hypothetical protein